MLAFAGGGPTYVGVGVLGGVAAMLAGIGLVLPLMVLLMFVLMVVLSFSFRFGLECFE
jgi:hypothetical protein